MLKNTLNAESNCIHKTYKMYNNYILPGNGFVGSAEER